MSLATEKRLILAPQIRMIQGKNFQLYNTLLRLVNKSRTKKIATAALKNIRITTKNPAVKSWIECKRHI